MNEFTEAVQEEGTTLTPHTQAVTAWLAECFVHLEAGEEIYADPFYVSGLTDEQIDTVIEGLDEEYDKEWGGYPAFHRNRQGCNAATDFARLDAQGRRALVEGLQRINAEYPWGTWAPAPGSSDSC